MTKMKGWWRGLSRRTVMVGGVTVVAIVALLAVSLPSVFAVHTLGLFELDGDAITDAEVLGEDWDLIYETYIGTADPESESDALLFIADEMGTMDDSFTEGSKDIDDIPHWAWTYKSVPDKNELTNAYAAVYPSGEDTITYFRADRYDTSGNAYMGFWFFQDRDGNIRIDLVNGVVARKGEPVHLTPTESRLLMQLVSREGETIPHGELLINVWGQEYAEAVDYLSVYIRYLREKLEDDPSDPDYIHTRWGTGYCFSGNGAPRPIEEPVAVGSSGPRAGGEGTEQG